MSEPDNFLARWSRRKAEQQSEPKRGDAPAEAAPKAAAAQEAETAPAERALPAKAPASDPASLPAIDSITAATDIRGFLQPGVPPELRNAALRRAWSVDPTIRDFRGLQENDWNFNDPNGIPGFGPLSSEVDVSKMASALFGDAPREERSGTDAKADDSPAHAGTVAKPGQDALANDSPVPCDRVQREENFAPQNKNSEPELAATRRHRRRGGALPQT